MSDIVDRNTRSRMMAGIKSTNTRPEMIIRRGLHHLGFRFRLHSKKLPGKPDLVLPKYGAVIQVQGCFWHGHDCQLFKWPSTRKDFWQKKILGNIERDIRTNNKLRELGWRILSIWECSLKGKDRLPVEDVLTRSASWLRSDAQTGCISGKRTNDTRVTR